MAKYKGKKAYYNQGGMLTRYDNGGIHEENPLGGVPVGPNSLVEQGETRGMPNSGAADYIFSDRIKVPGKNYTFAQASKKIENKYKRQNDKMSDESKAREIENLMHQHEEVRQNMMAKAENKYNKAMQTYGKGGFFNQAGATLQNIGIGGIDSALSVVGAGNVADQWYSNNTEGFAGKTSKTLDKAADIGGKVAPMVAGVVGTIYGGPAGGAAAMQGMKGIQSLGSKFNPEGSEGGLYGQEDKTNQIAGAFNQLGEKGVGMYGKFAGSAAYGGPINSYPNGGPIKGKYGSFDPAGSGIHNLQPGEQPLTPAQQAELGFAPTNATVEQEATYPRGRYKFNPYVAPLPGTAAPVQTGAPVTPYRNHAKAMAEDPAYRKAYFAAHPNMVPGYKAPVQVPVQPMIAGVPEVNAMGGGLKRSEDYGSENKPYPSVQSGDFAGGGRSYPIPTKADAVDALRLAGLHGRPDVKAKVYAKYPSLKHAWGGKIQYLNGGPKKGGFYDPTLGGDQEEVIPTQFLEPEDPGFNAAAFGFDQYNTGMPANSPMNNSIPDWANPYGATSPGLKSSTLTTNPDMTNPTLKKMEVPEDPELVFDAKKFAAEGEVDGKKFDPNSLYNIGNFAGSAYDIYRGLKGGDKVNFDRVTPDTVDYSKSRDLTRRDIKEGFRGTQEQLKSAATGQGAYLSASMQAAGQRDKTISDAIAKSYESEANTNAQLRNQSKYFNAQVQQQEAIARQQEKDIASNTLGAGIAGAGTAVAGMGRDKALSISQEDAKQYIGSGDFVPAGTSKSGKKLYKHKTTGQTYEIGGK